MFENLITGEKQLERPSGDFDEDYQDVVAEVPGKNGAGHHSVGGNSKFSFLSRQIFAVKLNETNACRVACHVIRPSRDLYPPARGIRRINDGRSVTHGRGLQKLHVVAYGRSRMRSGIWYFSMIHLSRDSLKKLLIWMKIHELPKNHNKDMRVR